MDPLRLLPLVALAGETSTPRRLASPLIAVVDPVAAPQTQLLLEPETVTIHVAFHPLLTAWLEAAGWTATATVPTGQARTLQRRPSPRSTTDESLDPLRAALDADHRALDAVLVRRPRQLDTLGAHPIRLGAGWLGTDPAPLRKSLDELAVYVHDVRSAGGLVCATNAWFELERIARSTLRVEPAATNPARARSRLGTILDAEERPVTAFARVEDLHLQVPVAVDARVLDVAAMAVAAGLDRPGLLPEQDRLASTLLASEIGAVLAPPPGAGKTVITAAALAELAPRHAVVAAPAGLLEQWQTELHRWAPNLSVALVRSVEQLRRQRHRHQVIVASHQTAARALGATRTGIDLLVLDEAHVLLRRSETATLLRRARRHAGRAWALTGSPDERTAAGSVGELVAWVRNLPASRVATASASAFTPIVAGADTVDHTRFHLPETRIETVPVTATRADLAMLDWVWDEPLPTRGLSRRRGLERRRLTLGDPGSTADTPLAAVPSKRAAMCARAAAHAASGGSVLLFSSSARVLEDAAAQLRACGAAAETLPGSSRRGDRVRTLAAFEEGKLPILAVPPSAQRGVNLQKADLIIHLDLPASAAEFVQRNGRAARIGSRHQRVLVLVPLLAGTADETWSRSIIEGDDDAFEQLAHLPVVADTPPSTR